MQQETILELYSKEFLDKVKSFKKDWHNYYKNISKEKTPQVDGTGKKIIQPKGNTGFDYIEESYMRECLDKHFPGWSVDMAAPLQFLGSEWVVAQIILSIIDEHLFAIGITPPVRQFYGVDSIRIQYGKGKPHTPENIIDVGDNCKQAVTSAIKYAINRLTHIGDDVYGKRLEMEGAGSYEEIITMGTASPDIQQKAFNEYIKSNHILISTVYKILNIKGLSEITNYGEALEKLKSTQEI